MLVYIKTSTNKLSCPRCAKLRWGAVAVLFEKCVFYISYKLLGDLNKHVRIEILILLQ